MKPITSKTLFYILALVAALAACSGPKGCIAIKPVGEIPQPEDSVLTNSSMLDTDLDRGTCLHGTPTKYRSQTYYENWNYRTLPSGITKPRYRESLVLPAHSRVRTGEDYGFELNHKLFYYFSTWSGY